MASDIHVVHVKALDRKGFSGLCRGGRKWSSDAAQSGPFAVTGRLLEILEAEELLTVRNAKPGERPVNPEPFDAPAPPELDPETAANERLRIAKAKNAALKAAKQAEELEAENAKLAEELAAKKAPKKG